MNFRACSRSSSRSEWWLRERSRDGVWMASLRPPSLVELWRTSRNIVARMERSVIRDRRRVNPGFRFAPSGLQPLYRVVICPSGGLLMGVSSLFSDFPKNISVPTPPKSNLQLSHPTPPEGRIAIVTDAGWGAVDAAASGAQRDAGRVGERPVSDQTAS
jgi:hypothetical protein